MMTFEVGTMGSVTGRRMKTTMRKGLTIGLLLAGLALQALAAPQVQDDLFAGAEKFAKGARSSTEVNLDRKMLGMASRFMADNDDDDDKDKDKDKGKDKDGKHEADLAKKLDFVIVRTYEYAKPGQYNRADVDEIQHRLDNGGWSHIVKERSAEENTDVCIKTDNNGEFSELVVISAEPTALTFVHLKGHMSIRDLTRIGGKYGVPQETPKPHKEDK